MLRYRLRRLPAARRAARARGLQGAQFPWESARTGLDVTPTELIDGQGRPVPVRTGQLEEHITADVAWAASHSSTGPGADELLRGRLGQLMADTARYWASRLRLDDDGRGHIDAVIGPDEYHELVDDNAFTNVMARWNLRRAADLADRIGVDPAEAARWRQLAEALVDNYDPETGRYEQFAGYYALDPITVADVGQAPIAADLLLGRERLAGLPADQAARRPDAAPPGPRGDGPRVAGGQPGLLRAPLHPRQLTVPGDPRRPARPGRADEAALRLFRMACRLDLDNLTGTTGGGLHMATFGGVWQALVLGFAGVRPEAEALAVDPRIPDDWSQLRLRLRFRGTRVELCASPDRFSVHPQGWVDVKVPGRPPVRVGPSGQLWESTSNGWSAR